MIKDVSESAEILKKAIDECQEKYPFLTLAEMLGLLETLKLELFIEQRD